MQQGSEEQEFHQAHERIKSALQRYHGATATFIERTSEVLLETGPDRIVLGAEQVREVMPEFRRAGEEFQRAYSTVFAVPIFAAPEIREQVSSLRVSLAESLRIAEGMRDAIQKHIDEVNARYSESLDPPTLLRYGVVAGLTDVVAEWDLAARRASAILNAFDERVVLPEPTDLEPPPLLPDRAINWREHVHSNPKILSGKPVIRGTRISVQLVLDLFSAGWTEDGVLESYPHLTREGIRAAFAYAAERVAGDILHTAAG